MIADGSGNTAIFTNNTGTSTTTLDSSRTIGTIAVASTGVRVLDGAGTALTLASATATPTISPTTNSVLAITAAIAGTQGFRKTGTSTLILYGANTYSGTTLLQSGTTQIYNLSAFGASGANDETVVSSGAQIRIQLSGTIAESFTISGRGSPSNSSTWSGRGAIRVSGNSTTLNDATLTGNITLSGSAEIFPDSWCSLTVAGPTSGTGGYLLTPGSGRGLSVTGNISHVGWITRTSGGSATLALSGSNSYTGSTGVDNGRMLLDSPFAIPSTTALNVSDNGILDLNGYDITIRTFGWRDDVASSNPGNSLGGRILDNSTTAGTTTITVTSGSFQLGTAMNDGDNGRKLALRVAGVDQSTIRLESPSSTFSGGLTILNGSGLGTRLRFEDPIVYGTDPLTNLTTSQLGTGTVTVGLAPTDKAQFYMGPGTYTEGVGGSTVQNDFVFNTSAGTDTPSGVLLNTTEAIFSGTMVSDQASVSFATGAIVPSSVAVLTGRVTSTGATGGLRLVGNGQIPGITVRLANATGTANDYQGATTVDANTTLVLGAADQVPNGAGKGNVSVSGNFNLGGFSETINGLSGSGFVDGGGGTPTLTVGDGDAAGSFSGVLRNTTGEFSLVKIGSGVQTLAGANTNSGPTSVSGGTLLVNGDQSGAAGAVTVASGATLGGTGIVGGITTIESGATLAPGASPGTLTFTQGLTLAAGGNYNWQILDATGTAGVTNGWDLVSVGGVLDVAATSGDPFKINLWSLSSTGPDVNGNALNFNASQGYTWKIASATGGITNFAADKFQIITGATNGTGGFSNSLSGGTFSLALSGSTDLNLVYTAGTPTVITINVVSGTQTQTQAGHPLLAGTTPVEKIGAGTVVFDQANTLTASTTVTQGTLELATADALSSSAVTVAAGAMLTVGPQVTAVVPSLVNNGLVDVGLGGLTVTSGQTGEALVAGIVAGRADGTWSGTSGITSSAAATQSDRAVGWIDNGDGSFTVAFAAAGDLNLNGVVDFDDVLLFVSAGLYDTGLPATWAEGDYDYNGVVDFDDVLASVSAGLFDTGPYNTAPGGLMLMGFGDDPGLMNGGFTAVPEPTASALLAAGLAAWGLARRPRRSAGGSGRSLPT